MLLSQAKLTQDGRTYYVDHNTQQTHWHHPRGLVKAAAKVRRASTKQLMIDENTTKRDMPALIELSSSDSENSDGESDAPLPNGWEQLQTAAGRPYYVRRQLYTHDHYTEVHNSIVYYHAACIYEVLLRCECAASVLQGTFKVCVMSDV
jgi:WW domain